MPSIATEQVISLVSQQGLERIRQARREKGWTVGEDKWLREASKIPDPHTYWEAESYAAGRIFAAGVSLATWRRFSYGQDSIDAKLFKAFCPVLQLNWEEVADRSPSPKPQVRWELVWSATIDDARKERVGAIAVFSWMKNMLETRFRRGGSPCPPSFGFLSTSPRMKTAISSPICGNWRWMTP